MSAGQNGSGRKSIGDTGGTDGSTNFASPSQEPASPPQQRSNEYACSPSVIKAHAGQLRELQSRVADFAGAVESIGGNFCGQDTCEKQAALTSRFAKAVDKSVADTANWVAKAEAECMSARVRHAAANQAVEELIHAANNLNIFLKDVREL